jgi:hypothetical protein
VLRSRDGGTASKQHARALAEKFVQRFQRVFRRDDDAMTFWGADLVEA